MKNAYQNPARNSLFCKGRKQVLITCLFFVMGGYLPAQEQSPEEGEDAMTPIMALNYSNFSLLVINEYNDRVILDQEYNNIINRINLTMIQDEEIIDIIKVLMDTLTQYRLSEGDKAFLYKAYEKNVENALFNAASGSLKMVRTVNVVDPSFYAQVLVGVGGAYSDYRNNMDTYRLDLDESIWELEKEAIVAINEANKKFIDVYWSLLKQYNAPDDWRLTQEQFKDYMNFMKDDDPERRHRKMKRREREYSVFPPYWYYRASAAFESSNTEDVLYCISKYMDARKGFFRKDIIYSAMLMLKVSVTDYSNNKENLISDINEMLFHDPDDARKRLFSAYKLIEFGHFDKAIPHLQVNFDNERLLSLSRQAMGQALSGKKDVPGLNAMLTEMIEDESISNLEVFAMVGEIPAEDVVRRLWPQISGIEVELDESLLKKDGFVITIPAKWVGDDVDNLTAGLEIEGEIYLPDDLKLDRDSKTYEVQYSDILDAAIFEKEGKVVPLTLFLKSFYGMIEYKGSFKMETIEAEKNVADIAGDNLAKTGSKIKGFFGKKVNEQESSEKKTVQEILFTFSSVVVGEEEITPEILSTEE